MATDRLRGEGLADAILGKIDAFEVVGFDASEPAVLAPWYTLLEAGLCLPLAGGSGKDGGDRAAGRTRTYAWTGPAQPLDYLGWIEAVRAGRTFVTNGPLLLLTVGGQGPGATIEGAAGQRLPVRVEAKSAVPFDRLELLVNGTIVAAKEAAGSRLSAVVETEWVVDEPAWLAARCVSNEPLPDGQVIFAHTSAIRLGITGRPFRPRAGVIESLVGILDERIDWMRNRAPWTEGARRDRLEAVFLQAREVLSR